MNYKKHYDLLMVKAKTRILTCYVEKHHVWPRCMGGSDDSSNIVALTPEEHFVAHKLLVKIYPQESKLVYAANKMCHGRINNRMYGWLRRAYSETVSNRIVSADTRKKFSQLYKGEGNPMYGKPSPCGMKGKSQSQNTRDKISQSNILAWSQDKNRKRELSKRMTGENSPLFGKSPSIETRKKLSAARTGYLNPMHGKSAVKGRKWIRNITTHEVRLVTLDEVANLLSQGWKMGRKAN